MPRPPTKKNHQKNEIIADYIDKYFCEHDEIPSVRDIVDGTGIPLSTVHRYLISVREDGLKASRFHVIVTTSESMYQIGKTILFIVQTTVNSPNNSGL